LDQVRSAYEENIQALKVEHAAALDEQVNMLEKQISNQNLELKATQDDLGKAKAALSLSLQEFESVNLQLEEARKSAEALVASTAQDRANEFAKLSKDLANAREDQAALHDVLAAQKESFKDMSENHTKELEEAAKGRAEEVTKLRAAHETEMVALSKDNSNLATKLSDVEGELATLKAEVGAEPISTPKSNGTAQIPSTGVTKEDIQRLHEAHNLKINDMQAEFEKSLKMLKEELETVEKKGSDLELEIGRKNMEISYLEQDQEENQDQITRYVKLYGFKSFLGGLVALAVILDVS
jgi:conserved oligomeric Golgi complex subunit 6